jgi:hypothetical protein
MRFLKTCTLTAALLLLGATSAWAWQYELTSNVAGPVAVDDTVTIDMHLDATSVGLQLLSFGILFDPTELAYDLSGTVALPPQGPGTSGSAPSYILYTGGKPYTIVEPVQYPAWLYWPNPPADKQQININYSVNNLLTPAQATGNDIYIATLLFDVIASGDGEAVIEICKTCGGNVLRVDDVTFVPETIAVTGSPILVTVPEPAATGLAVAAGLVCVYLARRRRRA